MCEAGSVREWGAEKDIWARDDLVTGQWRILHNQEPYNLYPHQVYSGDQIKRNELDGECGAYLEQEMCIQGFDGRP